MDIGAPRVVAYKAKYRCACVRKLGFGREGDVFATDQPSAVKFFQDRFAFDREREVYQVLSALHIDMLVGHAVPKLIRHDEALLAIEMSIVAPPFVLDFAGARTEEEAAMFDFEDHVVEEHHARLADLYGDRWMQVLAVAGEFTRRTGYVLMDIKPGNISF